MVYPSTAYDAKGLLKSAVRDNNPVLFFEHKFLYRRIKEELPEEDYTVPIGKAVVRREGSDVTIVSYAAMAHASLEAASATGERRYRSRSHRLAHAAAAGSGDDPCFGEKNQQAAGGSRRHADGRNCRRNRGIVCEDAFSDLDAPYIARVTALDTPVPYSPPLEEYFRAECRKKLPLPRGNWQNTNS